MKNKKGKKIYFILIKLQEFKSSVNLKKQNKKYVVKSMIAYNDKEKGLLLEKADEKFKSSVNFKKQRCFSECLRIVLF